MSIRNYAELSPYDFESLTRDLFQASWGEQLELFPPGKDGGIDVRLFRNGALSRSIQCKHAPGKSWSDIRAQVVREAAANRDRVLGEYYFVTSAKLSADAKTKIANLFKAQALEVSNIFGREDIDNLLNQHPSVEQTNYKLYLSSVVLERIFNNKAFVRNEAFLERLLERKRLFVHSNAFPATLATLNEQRIAIISGEPGVGKTTLAEMITLSLFEQDYQPVVVSEDIADVDNLWQKGEKQVFLYDDFLGQTSLVQKLASGEDRRMADTFERIRKSKTHMLLMTTREYILRAAQRTYARLAEPSMDVSKVIVDLATYTRFQRAQILYNHVYFSELAPSAGASLLKDKTYLKLVNHRNYNPRLIEMIIQSALIEGGASTSHEFAKFATTGMDNPGQLWSHILDEQLDVAARSLVLVMATLPYAVDFQDVRTAFDAYMPPNEDPKSFKDALKVVESVFLSIVADEDDRMVSFTNPGIRDFVIEYILRDEGAVSNLLSKSVFAEQLQSIYEWASSSRFGAGRAWSRISVAEQRRVREVLLEGVDTSLPKLTNSFTKPQFMSSIRVLPERVALILLRTVADDASRLTPTVHAIVDQLQRRWKADVSDRADTMTLIEELWPWLDQSHQIKVESATAHWIEAPQDPGEYFYRVKLIQVVSTDQESVDSAVDELVAESRARLQQIADGWYQSDAASEVSEIEDFISEFDRLDEIESELDGARANIASWERDEDDARDERTDAHFEDNDGDIDSLFDTLR